MVIYMYNAPGLGQMSPWGILNAPLWYNKKLINGHSFYINEWYKKGIWQVSDLLDEQGNMFDFEALKTRYGIRGTFLEYEALKNKIPNRWKNTLNDNTTTCITNRFNVTCNIYLQFVLKDKKKDVDDFMI